MSARVNIRYRQPDIFNGERRFTVFNERYIRVRRKRFKRELDYTIDLAALCPEGSPSYSIARHWLIASAVALLAFIILLYTLLAHFDARVATYTLPAAVVTFLLALGFGALAAYTFEHKYVFTSRQANIPLVELRVRKDDPAYRYFVEELERYIQKHEERAGLSPQDLRAGEIRTLRRMSTEGLLSTIVYEEARTRLLANSA
jgi:hypothetical protein